MTPSGSVSTFVAASAGLSYPQGLAFDASGNLYVSNYFANTISKVTPGGTVTTFVPASAGLSEPLGLAFDRGGNLYVANRFTNVVSVVTPSGTVTTLVPAFASPKFLAIDGNDNLYVAEGDNTVSKVTPSGTISTFVTPSTGLLDPSGLAFDNSGNLYVANDITNLVLKATPSLHSFAVSAGDASKLSAIGLTLNADGTFSGIVTSLPSPNPLFFTVIATDDLGDWGSAVISLGVDEVPAITSAASTTFAAGTAGSFAVTVRGFPAPILSEVGALPSGVNFDVASGVLSGMPTAGTAGSYPITFTASNGFGSDATQAFTLTVTQIGTISGVVFRDYNLDGQQESAEPGLAGQTLYLDLNNNGVFDAGEPTATTDANGAYSFSGLAPGSYTVRQVAFGGVLLTRRQWAATR